LLKEKDIRLQHEQDKLKDLRAQLEDWRVKYDIRPQLSNGVSLSLYFS
jgi:hypothetical protein